MTRRMLPILFLFISATHAAVQFSSVRELGHVSSNELNENSGLAASRLHPGILYGHNDHGDTNRIFALDPVTGDVLAILTIDGVQNHDWEDLCVGTCGQGHSDTCIYIADIGDENGHHPRQIYKVREPQELKNARLQVVDIYRFKWDDHDADSLLIDPVGGLYVISKAHEGDALFAKLPRDGWGSSHGVKLGHHDTVHLDLHTSHSDPQGADLSPNGRSMLVKTEEEVLYFEFSSAMDYLAELGDPKPQEVSTYVRRKDGEAVAWNVEGTGFYTLPEGDHPVFNYYTVLAGGTAGIVG